MAVKDLSERLVSYFKQFLLVVVSFPRVLAERKQGFGVCTYP
jgi:hypothetical protein